MHIMGKLYSFFVFSWVHIKWLLQDFYIDDVSTKFHQSNFSTPRNSGFGKSPDDHGRLLTKTKGLKSKRLFETTCYASISQMFGGWCGRNSDVTYVPKWNGFYRLDYLTGFQGLNNLERHRPDLKSLSHFRENSPYALPYSSTVLFKPPFCVATLSVTFSYQIYNIDKISKQSQWMSWMLVPSETGCCQHYLPTAKQQAVQELLIDYLSSGQGVEDELGKDVDWYWYWVSICI